MIINMKYFSERRSVRRYSEKEIPSELLMEMLEASMRAPTTENMQLYSVIVTTDEQIKERLLKCHFEQPQITNAPAVITFCADFNRFCKWCEISNANPGYDNFLSFTSALLDTAILTQQFNTIAELNGLGCCYIGTTTYNAKEVAETLNLPKRVVPITTITVGYPEETPTQVERLPATGLIHRDTYKDYSDKDIINIYQEKENLEVNKGYVAENNKQTLAQVFTDVRSTKDSNETFSKKFYDFIEKQGFQFPK